MTERGLLSTAEVAHRLGIKRASVYAYVSRGLLERDPASSHRHSLFDASAVERLAAGSRRPNRSGALEVTVETALTSLDPNGRVFYRGIDVIDLARFRSFEDVAELLWDGPAPLPWELDAAGARVISAVAGSLPRPSAAVELIPVAVAVLASTDAGRADRRPEAVRRAGVQMLAGILTLLNEGPEPEDRAMASRIWAAVCTRRPRPAQLAAVNAALITLADHELAASTLAARVAASAWADPYRVVLAGLGPLGGSLHGGASLQVAALLDAVSSPADAFTALERQLAAGTPAGFGHRVYRNRDPRADHLLSRLDAVVEDRERLERIRSVLEAAEALGLPAPNVDFALAALLTAMAVPPAAAPTIFSFARIVGLLAHAIEEYPHRLRFRPRATYVGPLPPS